MGPFQSHRGVRNPAAAVGLKTLGIEERTASSEICEMCFQTSAFGSEVRVSRLPSINIYKW